LATGQSSKVGKDVPHLAEQEPLDDLSAHEVFGDETASQNEQSNSDCDVVFKNSEFRYNCDKNIVSLESCVKDNESVNKEVENFEMQNTGVQLYKCQHCGWEFGCTS